MSGTNSGYRLRIARRDYGVIENHARSGLPNESCGLIAGRAEGFVKIVERVYPLTNIDIISYIFCPIFAVLRLPGIRFVSMLVSKENETPASSLSFLSARPTSLSKSSGYDTPSGAHR